MLVEEGILAAETYKEPGSRSRPKCVVTPKGMDLVPAVMGLLRWGDRYRADPEGPAVLSRHRGCGAHVDARIRCHGATPYRRKTSRASPARLFA
jgi:hypothetical protein